MNEIALSDSRSLTSSSDEILSHVHLINDVMRKVLKEGQHWGKVPGCGDKPALLKPGAEKILELFRLGSDMEITDKSGPDSVAYRVKIILKHQVTGAFIGTGIGECSSDEEKYKWRGASDEEFNDTAEDRRRSKWKSGRNGVYKAKQVRTNPADVANTVLKMAKKRALVDAALTATAASDIFAQDIEEVVEETPEVIPPKAIQELAEKAIEGKSSHPASTEPVRYVSQKQAGRFYYLAKDAGIEGQGLKDFLMDEIGATDTKMIPLDRYEELCSRLQPGQ